MRPLLLLPLLALTACDQLKPTGGDELIVPDTEAPASNGSLEVSLAATTAIAGETVGLTVTVTDADGALDDTAWVVVTSDLEDSMLVTDTTVRPTVAGQHAITVTVMQGDESLVQELPLQVLPAAVDSLDLALSDAAFVAGEQVEWSVSGEDRWGNEVDAAAATIGADAALSVDATTVSGTVAGDFVVAATLDGVTDEDALRVMPGPAAELAFTVAPTELEVGQTARAEVVLVDAWGNPADEVWSLSVDGGAATVAEPNITFMEEGWFTVNLDVEDSLLTESVGPFLIDSSGPGLTIDTPTRADWITDGPLLVTGTAIDPWSDFELTVQGEPVLPSGIGAFAASTWPQDVVEIIETVAVDADGNTSSDTRAVMVGDEHPVGLPIEDAIVVRIVDGPTGLDAFASYADEMVMGIDLAAMIPDPVFYDRSRTCVWGLCFTWYEAEVHLTDPYIGGTELDIVPRADGQLEVRFGVLDPSIQWSADGVAAEVPVWGSGDVTADAIRVTAVLDPVIVDGEISLTLTSVDAWTENFNFQWVDWLEDTMSFFGFDLDEVTRELLEDGIEEAVLASVPPMLEGAFQGLELGYSVDVQGVPLDIFAIPGAIDVDAGGVTVSLDSLVTSSMFVDQGVGSVVANYADPEWNTTGVGIAVNHDAVNQVLHALWSTPLLHHAAAGEELGLTGDELGILFPGVTETVLIVEPLLQPVVVNGTNGQVIDAIIGDVAMALYPGTDTSLPPLVELYATARAGLEVAVTGSELDAGVGEVWTSFNVTTPEPNSPLALAIGGFLDEFTLQMVDDVVEAVGAVEIPAVEGFTVANLEVSGAPGFLHVTGELARVP